VLLRVVPPLPLNVVLPLELPWVPLEPELLLAVPEELADLLVPLPPPFPFPPLPPTNTHLPPAH
jgi:hypothetical protein